jgi:Fe-S cluster assembly iron-binding protein IscA
MLTVTERAKETLARLKRQCRIDDDDVGLRLSLAASPEPGKGQFGLRADRETVGDRVIEYGGSTVLLVEEALAVALSDATIDAEAGDDLIINRWDPRSASETESDNGYQGEAR